jgi:ubiquinone/menaquinone biosynthesis C-methylase UbiE
VRLSRQRRDWEDLAAEDLYWSILSSPSARFRTRDTDEFLESGRAEIGRALERGGALGLPHAHRRALDFGCGAGRLTRALSERFEDVVGVDISEPMIAEARRVNGDTARFVVNTGPGLQGFADASFDLVYTSNVLQHIPDAALIQSYVSELARVLGPGGLLCLQLPSAIPARHRVQPRRRAYHALRALRVPRRVLFRRLRLQPIAMSALPAGEVVTTLERAGARVVAVDSVPVAGGVVSSTYFATRDGEPATTSSTSAS